MTDDKKGPNILLGNEVTVRGPGKGFLHRIRWEERGGDDDPVQYEIGYSGLIGGDFPKPNETIRITRYSAGGWDGYPISQTMTLPLNELPSLLPRLQMWAVAEVEVRMAAEKAARENQPKVNIQVEGRKE